jgi:ATP-dependent Clp protease adaptor protein ClpS
MTNQVEIEKVEKNLEDLKKPGKYKVVVCNDDYTPIEFVVSMLIKIFRHSQTAAVEITMEVHNKGRAVAGTYSYEIAEQKTVDSINLARLNGWPLIIKLEAE